jgi:hypothetical protein
MGEPQNQIRPLNLSTGAGGTVLKDITAPFGDPAAIGDDDFYSFSTWRLRIHVKANQPGIVAAVSFTLQSTSLACNPYDPNDFDCRFTATPAQCVPFFKDPSASNSESSLDPYRCAYYRVKDMPLCQASNPGACPFAEEFVPGTNDILSDILLNLTNPPSTVFDVSAYGPAPKGNPRLMRDPDSVNTGPLADQFFIDATTAVIDWPAFGTGTPNDYSPVQRVPSTAGSGGGCAEIIKPDKDSFNGGSAIKVRIRVTDGPRVNGVCTGNPLLGATSGTSNITLAIANPALNVLEIYCETPGNSLGCFKEVPTSPGEYQSTVDLTDPPFTPSTDHAYFFAITSVNVPSANPATQGAGQFPPTGRHYFICPKGGKCGS